MEQFCVLTTWQAGQTRKGFTNLPLPVGNSQTLFHTSCGYAFLQNAGLLSRQYPENQKKAGARSRQNRLLTPNANPAFSDFPSSGNSSFSILRHFRKIIFFLRSVHTKSEPASALFRFVSFNTSFFCHYLTNTAKLLH